MNATSSGFPLPFISLPLLVAGVLFGAAVPARAAESDRWRFDASVNLFMAGLSGDVTARGNAASIDAGFDDIVDHLKAGAAGRFTVGYDRWSFSTEFSYLDLGASSANATIDMDQWLVEPSLGYRFCDMAEMFAGVRYNNLSGEIRFQGPLGIAASGTQDWWDPIVGAQLSLPLLGRKLTLDGRFDVGGFGVGSDFTWQAYPYLNWRFAKWGSAQLGYRWLGTDYETGSGANRFVYDVVLQGPQIGFTFHF